MTAYKVQGGPAVPVKVSTSSPHVGGPAIPVYLVQPGDGYVVQGRPAMNTYLVTDPAYPVAGGPALPISYSANAAAPSAGGGPAIPISCVNLAALQAAMGGGAAWTPAQLSGLLVWLDASQIAGKVDGNTITTWSDLSGGGRDFSQSVAGQRPLYKTNILNGKPVVRFDGTDDILNHQFIPDLAQPTSIIMVAKFASADAIGRECAYGGLMAVSHAGTCYLLAADHGALPEALWLYSGGQVFGSNRDTNWHIFSARLQGATSTFRTDGVAGADGEAGNIGANVPDYFAIAGVNDSGAGVQYSDIDIVEFIMTSTALTVANFQQIEQYLSAKYGIAVI